MQRKIKREVNVKGVLIGGNSRITVQSMTNTDTLDIDATTLQINELFSVGCDIVRLAVSSLDEVESSKKIIRNVSAPLVADIQFDYKLAIACADCGFSKIRFNPGNIGGINKVNEVVQACKRNNVPIRIGVNGGSLEKDILQKYGKTALGIAESALRHIAVLERAGFYDIVVSVKSSNVLSMIEANRILSEKCDYPLHIGVTESGAYSEGLVKSAIGIGVLLNEGIGDTIRVSLSGDPKEEVYSAKRILRSLLIDENYCEIISCPTCSRCKYDLMDTIDKMRLLTKDINKKLKIAIMGCVVNGPGEAKDADFGVAGGKDKAVIFKKGEIIDTVEHSQIIPALKKLLAEFVNS